MYFKFSHVTLLCLIFGTTITWSAPATDNPVVIIKTSLGSIEGSVVSVTGNDAVGNVYEFLGIPYAKPPVGKLRFRKPEPAEAWKETYKATKFSNACVQSPGYLKATNKSLAGDIGEDCLHLNIWTPQLPTSSNPVRKTVMVFIHGGGFRGGSATRPTYYGATLSLLGDVVLVTLNYRLGILGFLNLGVEDAPGNQGLWDQQLALLWIRDHISSFGGDPERITLFGESAGSMSVGFQLLSPMNRGLFQRAIMQSGSPITHMLLQTPEEAHNAALYYAIQQGCHSQTGNTKDIDSTKIIECLRHIDVARILETEDEYAKANYESNVKYFYPVIADEFMPQKENADLSEEHTPVDLLIGFNRNEGSVLVMLHILEILKNKTGSNKEFTLEDAKTLVEQQLSDYDGVVRFYFQNVLQNSSADTLKVIAADAYGDAVISCPTVYFAEYFAEQRNPVYFYHFNHRHTNSPFEQWTGVVHAEELQYLFQQPNPNVINTEVEIELGRQMLTGWTSFAKTGIPEFPGVDKYPLYTEDNPVYVDLKPSRYTLGFGPRLRACNYWRCHLQRL